MTDWEDKERRRLSLRTPEWDDDDWDWDWDWDWETMKRIKLGLPHERMGRSGAYHSYMPGFMIVSIAPDMSSIQYQLIADGVTHIVPCNGLLQAFAMILQMIKEHGQTQFLPETVTDMDTNPNPNQED